MNLYMYLFDIKVILIHPVHVYPCILKWSLFEIDRVFFYTKNIEHCYNPYLTLKVTWDFSFLGDCDSAERLDMFT